MLNALLAYNHWANRRMLDLASRATPAQLAEAQLGAYGPLGELLRHMTTVEVNFLHALRDEPSERLTTTDVAELSERLLACEPGYRSALAHQPDLTRLVFVPWFRGGQGVELPVGDIVLQAVTHSVQHRADVVGGLSRFGLQPPAGLDYVLWVLDGRPGLT